MAVHFRSVFLLILLTGSINLYPQSVVINELMPSNTNIIRDEDGDYSDWIELYNNSSSVINLENYSLTDDIDQLNKWIFPKINLAQHQHLLVFASDKDRKNVLVDWNTIINRGDDWKYQLGNSEPPSDWNSINFKDSNWQTGPTGIGYSDGDDSTIISSTISLYTRKVFSVNDLDEIETAVLHIDYDDAFVAYLNGIEIARSNIGTPGVRPAYNKTADAAREALMYQGGKPEAYIIADLKSILVNGENVLAVQIHNMANSSDLSFIPFLTLGYNTKQSQSFVPPILDISKTYLTY